MRRYVPLLFGLLAVPAVAGAEDNAAATIDTGDTALVLIGAALVLLMTPGLAFFYGGLVRGKNVVHTMLMSVACMAVVGMLWLAVGYSLAFAPGPIPALLGGLAFAGFHGVGLAPNADLAATVPHASFALFQGMFAVITPALVSGAVVERMRVKAFLLFVALFSVAIYAPLAHWVWAPGGWLRELGALDFAGGTVVHINAAAAAVVAALVVGPRRGGKRDGTPIAPLPHNVPFALLGMGLLWFGWMGFNGASALAAGGLAAVAFANTFFAAAGAAGAWALLELQLHGKMSGVGIASGAVAGLVAITPAAGFVTPAAAALLGILAGAICLAAVRLRPRLGLDDSLDVFAIHGVAGILGALGTGLLATPAVNEAAPAGSFALLGLQLVGVVATIAFSGVGTFAVLKLVGRITPLRAAESDELSGLDLAEAGERGYAADSDTGTEVASPPAVPGIEGRARLGAEVRADS
jgi:Amt family ammonium transporter